MKTYVKVKEDSACRGLTKEKYYEVIITITSDNFGTGKGVIVFDDDYGYRGYDASFFE